MPRVFIPTINVPMCLRVEASVSAGTRSVISASPLITRPLARICWARRSRTSVTTRCPARDRCAPRMEPMAPAPRIAKSAVSMVEFMRARIRDGERSFRVGVYLSDQISIVCRFAGSGSVFMNTGATGVRSCVQHVWERRRGPSRERPLRAVWRHWSSGHYVAKTIDHPGRTRTARKTSLEIGLLIPSEPAAYCASLF